MINDHNKILEYQQNRDPYLFVDELIEFEAFKHVKATKNLSLDEWFFKVHWKNDPNMPGFLQCEAIVQATALAILGIEENKGKVVYLTKVRDASFLEKVTPNNKLIIEGYIDSYKRGIAKCHGIASINDKITCKMNFEFIFPDELNKYLKKP